MERKESGRGAGEDTASAGLVGDWCFLRQYLRETQYKAGGSGEKIEVRVEEYLGAEVIHGGGNKNNGRVQGHALKVYIKSKSSSMNILVIGGSKDDWMVKVKEMVKVRVLFSTHPLSRDNTKHSCRLLCSIEASLLKSSSSKVPSLPDACLGRVEYVPSVNAPYFVTSIDASFHRPLNAYGYYSRQEKQYLNELARDTSANLQRAMGKRLAYRWSTMSPHEKTLYEEIKKSL